MDDVDTDNQIASSRVAPARAQTSLNEAARRRLQQAHRRIAKA